MSCIRWQKVIQEDRKTQGNAQWKLYRDVQYEEIADRIRGIALGTGGGYFGYMSKNSDTAFYVGSCPNSSVTQGTLLWGSADGRVLVSGIGGSHEKWANGTVVRAALSEEVKRVVKGALKTGLNSQYVVVDSGGPPYVQDTLPSTLLFTSSQRVKAYEVVQCPMYIRELELVDGNLVWAHRGKEKSPALGSRPSNVVYAKEEVCLLDMTAAEQEKHMRDKVNKSMMELFN